VTVVLSGSGKQSNSTFIFPPSGRTLSVGDPRRLNEEHSSTIGQKVKG